MKKSIIVLGLGLGSLLFGSSCSLDEPPQNQLTKENAFTTEKDLNATTSAIHTILNMQTDENGFLPFIEAGEIIDKVRYGNATRNWNPRMIISLQSDWKGLYDLVFISHSLLDNIHKTQGLTNDRLNYHRGQALFSLGFGYLNIVQRYGDAILIDNSTRLTSYPQTTQLEILNKAIEYATEAYNILPVYGELKDYTGATLTNKQFANKGSAAALLAHLYAWKGTVIDVYQLNSESSKPAYEQAVKYCSELIDNKVGQYRLCSSPEELCEKFSNPEIENPEEIFTIAFDRYRDTYTQTPSPATYFTSWPVNKTLTQGDIIEQTSYLVYKQTIDKLYDSSDARRAAYFYEPEQEHIVNGEDYAIIHKWRTATYVANSTSEFAEDMVSINTNYAYWRLAAIHLLRAECNAKLGNNLAATQDLNVIRQRAGVDEYPHDDENDLKLAIFKETEKELLAEGSRYWAVIRNGYWNTELQGNFKNLSRQDVLGGALHLPLPEGAYKKNSITVNTALRQSLYWSNYK